MCKKVTLGEMPNESPSQTVSRVARQMLSDALATAYYEQASRGRNRWLGPEWSDGASLLAEAES